jgi:hypothetical protein
MRAVCYFEATVMIYHATRRHNPEDSNLHRHSCKNLKYLQRGHVSVEYDLRALFREGYNLHAAIFRGRGIGNKGIQDTMKASRNGIQFDGWTVKSLWCPEIYADTIK